jgi:coenzyme F420-reducing hydrogenase beta subunit
MPTHIDAIKKGELYAGYAVDESVRPHASSGGVVSAALIDLLERRAVEGALVSRIVSRSGRIDAVTEIVRDRKGVLTSAGSSYIDTPVLDAVMRLPRVPGKAAVVGLPCQVRVLRRMLAKHPELREKTSIIIGLFCRGAVRRAFYEDLFARYRIDQATIDSVKVVRGHVKGEVVVSLQNGGRRSIPFQTMNAYRIAGIHQMIRCIWCDEHLAVEADIAVGDIFTPEFKKRPIKHSAFIGWSERGAELLEDMCGRNVLAGEHFGIDRYRSRFARIERFGKRLAPRYFAARLAGIKPPGHVASFFNPFHALAWTILCANSRMSRTRNGRKFLFALPPWAISFEALLVRALSRL